MQANQSSTASEIHSCSESHAALPSVSAGLLDATVGRPSHPGRLPAQPDRDALSCPALLQGDGLLHDARNLMGALGLYCDLLSLPGVLKPEHRHYALEVRQLGERSAAMIQRLMEHRIRSVSHCPRTGEPSASAAAAAAGANAGARFSGAGIPEEPEATVPVSLRDVVERSSGLLNRVAGGKAIEIGYGAAASVPVCVNEEAVERILVNLVRNAAAAINKRSAAGEPAGDRPCSIRIGVGQLVNRVGDPRPWPFRRVRLTVEDSGCGMPPEQLERLLSTGRAPSRSSHGIGFRVVRELVAASSGDLKVMSTEGAGTRVQIEWPIIPPALEIPVDGRAEAGIRVERRLSC